MSAPIDIFDELALIASTDELLAAAATIDTGCIDAAGYEEISYSVYADQDGTLVIYESVDGTTFRAVATISFAASGAPSGAPTVGVWQRGARFVKVIETNTSGTVQTVNEIEVVLRNPS